MAKPNWCFMIICSRCFFFSSQSLRGTVNINVNSRNFCFISRRIWSRDVPATSEVQRCSKLCKSLMIPSLLVLNWPASELFYLSGFSTEYNNLLQTKFEWWISKQKRGVKIVKSCLQWYFVTIIVLTYCEKKLF